MSELVSREAIEAVVDSSFPPHLDVIRQFFKEYDDGLLNHSLATDVVNAAQKMYNQFETVGLDPAILVFDPKLKAYSDLDIRRLVSMALGGEGIAFFSMYFAHFFNRFELHYSDIEENLFEQVTRLARTDEGFFTDEGTYTDDGAGSGVCCIHAQVILDITEVAAALAVWDRTISLLALLKPARLFVFHVPVVDVRLNALLVGDPEYDASLVSGDDPSFSDIVYNTPDKLMLDANPVWNTDGTPALQTDGSSSEGFLGTLNVLTVRYADAPAVDVALSASVDIAQNAAGQWCYRAQAELPKDIVYLAIGGSMVLASMTVLKPVYIKPFNTDNSMRLRISWAIPDGYGEA